MKQAEVVESKQMVSICPIHRSLHSKKAKRAKNAKNAKMKLMRT
jgi:hypothetical protein